MPSNQPVAIEPQAFKELKRQVRALRHSHVALRRQQRASVRRHQALYPAPQATIFRGLTNEAISKGTSDKTVSRYNPGTTDDSGEDDTVTNELINIGSGKVVHYFGQVNEEGETVYYITSVECPAS